MSYELSWRSKNALMLLEISGNYTVAEAIEVNRMILEELDKSNNQFAVLIDASEMARSFDFRSIRNVQSFMNHDNLTNILVASRDRSIRLTMLVIFRLSKARLHLFEDLEEALESAPRLFKPS